MVVLDELIIDPHLFQGLLVVALEKMSALVLEDPRLE